MNHLKHYNRWSDLPHDGKKTARRRTIGNVNLFIVPPCIRSRSRTRLPSRRRPM